MKIRLEHVRSMTFEIETCGDPEAPDTEIPMLFHGSFDNVGTMRFDV